MLIILFLVIIKLILPELGIYVSVQLDEIMPQVIGFIGIISVLSVFGIKIANGLSNTVANGILKAIGYVGKQFLKGLSWLFRTIVGWIPGMYKTCKGALVNTGMGDVSSTILAALMVFLAVLLII